MLCMKDNNFTLEKTINYDSDILETVFATISVIDISSSLLLWQWCFFPVVVSVSVLYICLRSFCVIML